MTYTAFLAIFIGVPLAILLALLMRRTRSGARLPDHLTAFPPFAVLTAHAVVAVLYTTPWDNYLVATGVWWYDPELVTGIVIGWVPLEEYVFFVLQTLMTGSLLLLLLHRAAAPAPNFSAGTLHRALIAIMLPGTVLWLASAAVLWLDWLPGTYLALILIWALPPILLQLYLGVDVLFRERSSVVIAIASTTLYLALADTLAIRSGTWVIDPAQSTGILLGSLPIEEFIFFFITNTLVVFGVTLVLALATRERIPPRLLRAMVRSSPASYPRSQSNV